MRGERKVRQGIVVSTKMQKTIVVRVDEVKAHPKYFKTITVSKNYHVHDEKNEARVGDEVAVMETRPLSRTKRWRLLEIKKRGAVSLEKTAELNNNVKNLVKEL
jgi:small subunit ribosomal protein S17